jgi:hypothetical protein
VTLRRADALENHDLDVAFLARRGLAPIVLEIATSPIWPKTGSIDEDRLRRIAIHPGSELRLIRSGGRLTAAELRSDKPVGEIVDGLDLLAEPTWMPLGELNGVLRALKAEEQG